MSLARLSFQKALLLFCLPPTPSLHPLPKTGLKIMPSSFLGFPTQLGPEKALKLEQGLGWGGRGYGCSWWEGAGGGNGQLSSQARGREQRSLGWPALSGSLGSPLLSLPFSRQMSVLYPSLSSSCPASLGQRSSPGTSSPPLGVSIDEAQLS